MIALNTLFFALFCFSVVVQYNDPDPVRWMAIYAAAAVGCVLWWRRISARPFHLATAAIALAWAADWLLNLHLGVPLREALADWQMHAEGSEEAREAGGLLLVTFWMLVLAGRPRPKLAPAPS